MMAKRSNEGGFIRIEPPLRVLYRVAGDEREGIATAICPTAAVVAPSARTPPPPEGTPVEARLDLGTDGSPLAAEAIAEPADGDDAAFVLRFTRLEEDARARLDTFITRNRKSDHIRICAREDVETEGLTTGFEAYRLPHEALPEIAKSDVDLRARFLGKRLGAPVLISCMTGGSELAKTVNRRLAAVAARLSLPLGLGSARVLLENRDVLDTFQVRDIAPDVLLIANIGAVQLNYGVGLADCEELCRILGADALALHLNPLQEAVQPEGDTDFRGLKAKVERLAAELSVPVILKEVGNGLSADLARWVRRTAIAAVDVAGAGGTSWAKVESYRSASRLEQALGRAFAGWGIPTAESLVRVRRELPDRPVIASGGVRDGIDVAKAIALGADLVGVARPFLEAALRSEEEAFEAVRLVVEELRVATFCAGAATVEDLSRVRVEHVSR
jgi:isopentenyl-diphosphate delta-isomerase